MQARTAGQAQSLSSVFNTPIASVTSAAQERANLHRDLLSVLQSSTQYTANASTPTSDVLQHLISIYDLWETISAAMDNIYQVYSFALFISGSTQWHVLHLQQTQCTSFWVKDGTGKKKRLWRKLMASDLQWFARNFISQVGCLVDKTDNSSTPVNPETFAVQNLCCFRETNGIVKVYGPKVREYPQCRLWYTLELLMFLGKRWGLLKSQAKEDRYVHTHVVVLFCIHRIPSCSLPLICRTLLPHGPTLLTVWQPVLLSCMTVHRKPSALWASSTYGKFKFLPTFWSHSILFHLVISRNFSLSTSEVCTIQKREKKFERTNIAAIAQSVQSNPCFLLLLCCIQLEGTHQGLWTDAAAVSVSLSAKCSRSVPTSTGESKWCPTCTMCCDLSALIPSNSPMYRVKKTFSPQNLNMFALSVHQVQANRDTLRVAVIQSNYELIQNEPSGPKAWITIGKKYSCVVVRTFLFWYMCM